MCRSGSLSPRRTRSVDRRGGCSSGDEADFWTRTPTATTALPTPRMLLGGGRFLSLRLLDDQPDLTFQHRPLMPIDRALDPVVRILPYQRQQSDDDVGARRIIPAARSNDRFGWKADCPVSDVPIGSQSISARRRRAITWPIPSDRRELRKSPWVHAVAILGSHRRRDRCSTYAHCAISMCHLHLNERALLFVSINETTVRAARRHVRERRRLMDGEVLQLSSHRIWRRPE